MPIAGKHELLVLVVYDIRSPKRLARMGRRMKDFGVRVQNSVFECRLAVSEYPRLKDAALKIVDPRVDSLRLYRICAACEEKVDFLGAEVPGLPDDVLVL